MRNPDSLGAAARGEPGGAPRQRDTQAIAWPTDTQAPSPSQAPTGRSRHASFAADEPATPPPDDAPPLDTRITVIVLTWRRKPELARTLARLAALPEKPAVIVVDNGSADGSEVLAASFPRTTAICAASNIGAAARNLGAEQASTPYIAFCDDDTWWQPGSVRAAADLLDACPNVAAVTARVTVGAVAGGEMREDPTCALMRDSPLGRPAGLPGPAILGLLAGATAFRREAFLAAGGYHPRYFIGGEEALLALDLASAGWQLVYAEQLGVHHAPSALRDAPARASLLARNACWTAWLRLPWPAALAATLRLAPRLWRDAGWRGCLQALRGWGWIRGERRVLPAHVERMRRRVEAARG